MTAHALEGGFADPAIQSAHAFRAIMEAMARPGTVQDVSGAVPPAPMSAAAGAVLLTLCDGDTPLYLAGAMDCPEVRDWVAFHTGAPIAERDQCAFALGTWDVLLPLEGYPLGTSEYPDRSATLIVEMPQLAAKGMRLQGPGIRTEIKMTLPETDAFVANARHFPLGLDFLFTCETALSALPRTTKVS